jgi:TetR/AcrR family transcriptional regulator
VNRGEGEDSGSRVVVRRWGSETALIDDDDARRRLIEAAGRCIAERGSIDIGMAAVADEAGVARSTLYRYFQSRDELIVGLLVSRVGAALDAAVRSLRYPKRARRSISELILQPLDLVAGNPLNEALFSSDSGPVVSALQLQSERLIDSMSEVYGPLLEGWQADGQIWADLNVRETLRWMNAVSLMLLGPPWRDLNRKAKRDFLERYLLRALLTS